MRCADDETRHDGVVLAVPAHAFAALRLGGPFGARAAELATIPHAPVAVVTLGFARGDVTHALDGFGVVVPAVERCRVLGTLFTSTLFPGRAPPGHVTLTTFVDVPWNGPLYAHLGFTVMSEAEIGPELRSIQDGEAAHGLDPARRVCMRLDLSGPINSAG